MVSGILVFLLGASVQGMVFFLSIFFPFIGFFTCLEFSFLRPLLEELSPDLSAWIRPEPYSQEFNCRFFISADQAGCSPRWREASPQLTFCEVCLRECKVTLVRTLFKSNVDVSYLDS